MKTIIMSIVMFLTACSQEPSHWSDNLFDIIGTDQPDCLVEYPNSTIDRNYDHQGVEFSSTIYIEEGDYKYYIMCVVGEQYSSWIGREDLTTGKTIETCFDDGSWGDCE